MKIEFVEKIVIDGSSHELFRQSNDVADFPKFTGFGPVPGIRQASYVGGGVPRLGAKREVINTDGSRHTEEIVRFEPPVRHTSRIRDLQAPFRWLVRWGEDDWQFEPEGAGTRIVRTFGFELTTPVVLPIAAVLQPFLRQAVRRHLRHLKADFASPQE